MFTENKIISILRTEQVIIYVENGLFFKREETYNIYPLAPLKPQLSTRLKYNLIYKLTKGCVLMQFELNMSIVPATTLK